MISNKKIILVFLTIAFNSIYCIAQSKMINGIEIKVPEELVYQDDIKSIHLWSDIEKNKLFSLQYFKSNNSDYESRKASKLDSETTVFIDVLTIDLFGNKYDIQINFNEEKVAVLAVTSVYRNGYKYVITYGLVLDANKILLNPNYVDSVIEILEEQLIYFIEMILTS